MENSLFPHYSNSLQKHNQHSGLSQLDNLQDATDGRENGQKTQSQAGYLPSVQVHK